MPPLCAHDAGQEATVGRTRLVQLNAQGTICHGVLWLTSGPCLLATNVHPPDRAAGIAPQGVEAASATDIARNTAGRRHALGAASALALRCLEPS
eukprot:6177869-Pleurochrysis_carterae.AAC.3